MGITSAEALQLISKGDSVALAEAFRDLCEKERRELRPAIKEFYRLIERHYWRSHWADAVFAGEFQCFWPGPSARDWRFGRVVFESASLAMLAVDTPAIGTKIGHVASDRAATWVVTDSWLSVLEGRGKKWVAPWVERALESGLLGWFSIRALVSAGLCKEPESEAYIVAFGVELARAAFPLSLPGGTVESPTRYLRAHSEHLPNIYRLFTVDCGAFLVGCDPYAPEGGRENWEYILRTLVEEGLLDRDRLIDLCLERLAGDLIPGQNVGISALLESITPTRAELATRQKRIEAILAAPASRTALYGVRLLRRMEKDGVLDVETFMAASPLAFRTPNKGPCAEVLQLMARAGERAPHARPAGVPTLIDHALLHAHQDIAVAASELLVLWKDALSAEAMAKLSECLQDVPAAAQRILNGLPGAGKPEVKPTETVPSLEDLRARAKALPAPMFRLARVDDALAAIEAGGMPAPLELDLLSVPVSTGLQQIEAVSSVDELLDLTTRTTWEGMDIERILDGISRFAFDRCPDFERRATPLLRQWDGADSALAVLPAHYELISLVRLWLSGATLDRSTLRHRVRQLKGSFNDIFARAGALGAGARGRGRIEAIMTQLASGNALPLLACPTHTGGWVDGRVLVRRLAVFKTWKCVPDICEMELSLWRLMPDHRPEALEQAMALSHPWSEALRWALGKDVEEVPSCNYEEGRVWLAAAHARYPRKYVRDIGTLRDYVAGAIDIPDTTYTWSVPEIRAGALRTRKRDEHRWGPRPKACSRLLLEVEPADSFRLDVWQEGMWNTDTTAAVLRCPLNRDRLFANSIFQILDALESRSAALPELVDLLRAPDEPCTTNAMVALLISMVSANADTRGAAVDAAITCIQDGRLAPEKFANVLSLLGTAEWFKVRRLCESLALVAQVSQLHAYTAASALESLLLSYTQLPKNVYELLGLLLELRSRLACGLSPQVAAALESLKGGGKSAKLAGQLLNLQQTDTDPLASVRVAVLEARVVRAERWANTEKTT